MSELLARHRAVIPNWVGIYYDEPIEIVSGKGCRVTDAQGRGYLDFFAGILTNMLGYDVPEVRDAVERQIASGVVHTSTLYLIRGQVELAEKIAEAVRHRQRQGVLHQLRHRSQRDRAARRAHGAQGHRGSGHARELSRPVVRRRRGDRQRRLEDVGPQPVRHPLPARRGPAAGRLRAASATPTTSRPASTTCGPCCPAGSTPPTSAACWPNPIQGVGGFTMPPDGLFAAYKEVLDEHGILLISRRGADRLGPDRRALLGHRRARRHPGRDDVRQGPRQRLRHRRRGGPRRPARRDPRQRHLHLRRQPGRDRGGQRHPGLRALARPAAQRQGHRGPDHRRAPGGRAEPRHGRRGARQGPDVRRRPGRPGHEAAQPAAGQPDARGDEANAAC